jgi:cysteine-rich repeat protein
MQTSAWMKTVLAASVATLGALPMMACGAAGEDRGESSSQALSTCGDGVRDDGEQCDDGNTRSLDGCSATCKFEQVHRINNLDMQFVTGAFCPRNALGTAIKPAAHSKIKEKIREALADGSISILVSFDGLDDLSGVNAAAGLKLGTFTADPKEGPNYDGLRDLDWWYTPAAGTIDANQRPLASIDAAINNKVLTAGPGNMAFALSIAGTFANIALSNVKLKATVGAVSAPSAGTATTGHAASENLDPALKSFASTSAGELCGDVSAGSLAAVKVPSVLQAGGSIACTQAYTDQNSALDLFVGGCNAFFVSALDPVQPDQASGGAPIVGAGAPYKFAVNDAKKVTGCKDKTGASVDLDKCLKSAAYSASFKFGTGRVVAKN